MSSKRTSGQGAGGGNPSAGPAGRSTSSARGAPASPWRRPWVLLGTGLVVALLAVVVGWAALSSQPGSGGSGAAGAAHGTVVQAKGGHWTNVSPDTLASMMKAKNFTLLNVKTPYIGEIAGTDLYIPYAQLQARASELPADKTARIVVYCRSGNESAIAAQTLIDLGYTSIDNLDGGMNAWTASGHQLVQQNRS